MNFGPAPLEIYEMAKGEAIWLAELKIDNFPWKLEGYRLSLVGNANPHLSVLSETDRSEVESAFKRSRALSFSARTAVTHGRDWQKANLGMMRYEDMLDETPEKPEVIEYLNENARFMRL
jgi:hypothetical protein